MSRSPLPLLTHIAFSSLALVPLTHASNARAADSPEACIAAHAIGQEQRKNSALLAARSSFAACAAEGCPDVIRSDCSTFGREVEAALPSVIFAIPRTASKSGPASVRVDSATQALSIDGTAVPLDPGQHAFVFLLPDGRTDTQTITVREGEKSRRVEGRFVEASTAVETKPSFRVPVLTYVFGGVAAAAGASFAYFALAGRSQESKLDECAPHCDRGSFSDERDSMRRNYLVADISLGVAVASLGLGTYFLLQALPSNASSQSEKRASLGISGSAFPGGFRVGATGRF